MGHFQSEWSQNGIVLIANGPIFMLGLFLKLSKVKPTVGAPESMATVSWMQKGSRMVLAI